MLHLSCKVSAPLSLHSLPFCHLKTSIQLHLLHIRKTAANFTLNKVLLMLNAYFCFYKFFHGFIIFITILSDIEKVTRLQNFFEILLLCKLKKVENHRFR